MTAPDERTDLDKMADHVASIARDTRKMHDSVWFMVVAVAAVVAIVVLAFVAQAVAS